MAGDQWAAVIIIFPDGHVLVPHRWMGRVRAWHCRWCLRISRTDPCDCACPHYRRPEVR